MNKNAYLLTISKAILATLTLTIISACGGSSNPVITAAAPESKQVETIPEIKQVELYKFYGENDSVENSNSTANVDRWNEAVRQIFKIDPKITQEKCLTYSNRTKNIKYIWTGAGFLHILTLREDEAAQLQQLGYAPFIITTSEKETLTDRVCLPGAVLSSTKTL